MTSTRQPMRGRAARTAIACGVLVLAACSAKQTGKARPSGFLGDYSKLAAGSEGQALLVYVNPAADFGAYTRILIDPVTIWRTESTAHIPRDDALILADDLDDALRLTLEEDYRLSDGPGPGVMRLRVAITEAEGSRYVEDAIGGALDPELRAARVNKPSSETRSFIGEAGVEGEIVDSVSGERLLAAVDRRAGARRLRPEKDEWDDVEEAFQYWAERLRARLSELRRSRQ